MRKEPIGKLISALHRQNQKKLVKMLAPYGIGSGGQHSFLKLILAHPGITQDELTQELKFDKATTARSVRQLEESGYIERIVDDKDRRSYLIFPTPKALEFEPVLQEILKQLNTDLTRDLTAVEEEQLVSLLKKVISSAFE